MADDLELSLGEARRLAVGSQHLAGPEDPEAAEPAGSIDGMRRVLRRLRVLQIDPVNVVARSHLLVLWSRLGEFDRGDLDTLLWRERWLFAYWAHAASIVLTEDYPIHRAMMREYQVTVGTPQKRDWLAANEDFRRYVLDRPRDSGPNGSGVSSTATRCTSRSTSGGSAATRCRCWRGSGSSAGSCRGWTAAGPNSSSRGCSRGRMRRAHGGSFGGGGDRIAGGVRGRRFGQLRRRGGPRRILSLGESAGRSRRAQAR